MSCPERGQCTCPWAKICVRLSHTALCIGVPVSLLFKDTVLSEVFLHGEHLVIGILYTLLLVLSLTMYFVTCCVNPGYLRAWKPWKQDELNENNNRSEINTSDTEEGSSMLKFNTEDGDFKFRLCDYCEIQQPMRAKHCEDCGQCVRKYDHHCPWLEACIGERNHKFFWLFLLSTAVLIACTFYIAWNGIAYRPQWGDWAKVNALLFVDLGVLVCGGLVVGGLLAFHTFLMLQGLTTWEAAARERITYLRNLGHHYNPFNEGVGRNLYHFLCRCRSRKWEAVYAAHARSRRPVA